MTKKVASVTTKFCDIVEQASHFTAAQFSLCNVKFSLTLFIEDVHNIAQLVNSSR